MEQKECILKGTEYWEQLVRQLGFLDIKILENLYLPAATTTYFDALLKKLYRLNVKRTAIRNHVRKLEELGLIETIKSGLLLVNSISDIQDNARKLIVRCKLRWDEC